MRNAQQELNLHVNGLQTELEGLVARIERMLESEPDADGVRSMDWPTPGLPARVVCALLEGYRDAGRDFRFETRGRDLRLVSYPDPAAPVAVIA